MITDILLLVLILGFAFWCLTFAALIERVLNYGRNPIVWLIIAVIFTPIVAILLVLVFGETSLKRRERIEEEESWRVAYRKKNCNQ